MRFDYTTGPVTAMVTATSRAYVTAILECGSSRGESKKFEIFEMVNCTEVFGSGMLQHLYNEVERSEWSDATKVKSRELPIRKPALKKQFMCPVEVTYKRK